MQDTCGLTEHKELFNEWLQTTKANSSFISKVDLEAVKNYLKSEISGEKNSTISSNLKRRIKTNRFMLASFPSETDSVCVLKKSKENIPLVGINTSIFCLAAPFVCQFVF